LPALETIGGAFQIEENSSLLEVLAPSLTTIDSWLQIRQSFDLHTIDFSSIECVSDFVIEDHALSETEYHDLLVALTSGC